MSDLHCEVRDGVGYLTMNRPERRNALSIAMITGLATALDELEASTEVGAVVLRGAGRAFCAGGDVQDFDARGGEGGGADRAHPEAIEEQRRQQRATVGRIHAFSKPVVASISGAAAGAGLGLALAADFRIGGPRAVFATAFAGVGLGGDFGVAWLLHHLVGPAKARELMFLNPRLSADEAQAIGLLHWVTAEDELEARTTELATRLADGPSHALAAMKRNLLDAVELDLGAAMDVEVPRHKATGLTEEHIAAVRAFVEKRQPTFPRGWHDADR